MLDVSFQLLHQLASPVAFIRAVRVRFSPNSNPSQSISMSLLHTTDAFYSRLSSPPKYESNEGCWFKRLTVSANAPPPYTFMDDKSNEEMEVFSTDEDYEVSIALVGDRSGTDASILNARRCVASSRVLMEACRKLKFQHFSNTGSMLSSLEDSLPRRTSSLQSLGETAETDRSRKCIPLLHLDGLPHPDSFHIITSWIQHRKLPSKDDLGMQAFITSRQAGCGDAAARHCLRKMLRGLLANADALDMSESFWADVGAWLAAPFSSADIQPKTTKMKPHGSPSRGGRVFGPTEALMLKDLQSAVFSHGVDPCLQRTEAIALPKHSTSLSSLAQKDWSEVIVALMTSIFIHNSRVPSAFIEAFLSSANNSWSTADRLALVLWWARGKEELQPAHVKETNQTHVMKEAQNIVGAHIDVGDVSVNAAARIRDLLTEPWELIVGGLVMKGN
ncbi:hypothetical protein HDU67_002661 [Dinochytrium kinnereticum]|nr:hypothetical protein HDU67_002661 [Dinochytrium kinnereticum]